MFLKRRLALLASVISALAVAAAVVSASAATLPAGPAIGSFGCPLGITNPATGCGPYPPTVLTSLTYPSGGDGTTARLVPASQRLRFDYAAWPGVGRRW